MTATMQTRPVINPAGAHRGCEAGKLYELFMAGEACLGRGVATLAVSHMTPRLVSSASQW